MERCRTYEINEVGVEAAMSRTGNLFGKRLQKIDYIEYVEKSGLATLNFMLDN